ncbi:hypothetical protein ES708_23717 [subsurface metagenome]
MQDFEKIDKIYRFVEVVINTTQITIYHPKIPGINGNNHTKPIAAIYELAKIF